MAEIVTIGDATLYLGDCMDILPTLGKVDAVITDPPYGINFNPKRGSSFIGNNYAGGEYKPNFQKIHGDDKEFDPTPFLHLNCLFWGANNFAHYLPSSNGWLIWHKTGGITGFKMSECELAWSNMISSTRHIDHMWHGFKRDSESGQKVLHPTQKPVVVMAWCIEQVGNHEIILDPYMGSGTTGVAAIQLGRKFIGIERDPKYFEIACKRIEQASKQVDMFIEPLKQEQVSLAI